MGNNNIFDSIYLSRIEKYVFKKLKKVYGRKGAKAYSKLVRIIYSNLSLRYGFSVKQFWNCLPLKIIIKRKINGAYGKNYIMKGLSYSVIELNKKSATYNTFIHEFGHYLKKLICFAYNMYLQSNIILDDIKRINNFIISRDEKRNSLGIFNWSVQEEEDFACSWERYVLNGHPSAYPEIFDKIKEFLIKDINSRSVNEVTEAYSLINISDDITDLFNNFIKTNKRTVKIPVPSFFGIPILKRRKINSIKKILITMLSLIILSILVLMFKQEIIFFVKYLLYTLFNNHFFKMIYLKIRLMI